MYYGNSASLGKCHLYIQWALKNYTHFPLWFIYKAFLNPRKSPCNVIRSLHECYCLAQPAELLLACPLSPMLLKCPVGRWLQRTFLQSEIHPELDHLLGPTQGTVTHQTRRAEGYSYVSDDVLFLQENIFQEDAWPLASRVCGKQFHGESACGVSTSVPAQ